jgi:hypothetical protein
MVAPMTNHRKNVVTDDATHLLLIEHMWLNRQA